MLLVINVVLLIGKQLNASVIVNTEVFSVDTSCNLSGTFLLIFEHASSYSTQ